MQPAPPAGQTPPEDDHGRDRDAQGRPRQGQGAADGARVHDRARRQDPRRSSSPRSRASSPSTRSIEEEIFYPALKEHPKAKDIVLEGYEEHHVVDLLMGELEALDVADETWGAKAKVMKENIEHHIEEEEGEMFKQARQVFDRQELEDLGARMAERKAQRPAGARRSRRPLK